MKQGLVAALVLSGAATASPAFATTTYNFNQVLSGNVVTGQIVTDGTTGFLVSANIISFNFTGGGFSVTPTPANSVAVVTGSNLSATATNLSFDFSGLPNRNVIFFDTGTTSYLCIQVTSCSQPATPGIAIGIGGGSPLAKSLTGVQVIATTAAVPETSAWR